MEAAAASITADVPDANATEAASVWCEEAAAVAVLRWLWLRFYPDRRPVGSATRRRLATQLRCLCDPAPATPATPAAPAAPAAPPASPLPGDERGVWLAAFAPWLEAVCWRLLAQPQTSAAVIIARTAAAAARAACDTCSTEHPPPTPAQAAAQIAGAVARAALVVAEEAWDDAAAVVPAVRAMEEATAMAADNIESPFGGSAAALWQLRAESTSLVAMIESDLASISATKARGQKRGAALRGACE